MAIILLSLLSFSACEEQVEKGNSLSDEARESLRRRAARKCISESDSTIKDFYENSNEKLKGYNRQDTWKLDFAKDDDVLSTSSIYVWKVTLTHVYFRIRLVEGSATTNYFLKMDEATNIDMIRNLQRDKCNKDITMNFSSSKMTVNIEEPRINEDSETESEREFDYRVESQYPAFFGALNRKETKRYYDKDDDDTVSKTENFDYTIERLEPKDEPTQPASYNDNTIINRKYCVVPRTAAPSGSTLVTYEFPFILNNCTDDSDPDGPDADGDGNEDFDPATELTI